ASKGFCARTFAQQIDAARDCGMASLYTRAADRARLAKGAITKLARTETAHSIPDRVPLRRQPPLVRLFRLAWRAILRTPRCRAVQRGWIVRLPALLWPGVCEPARTLVFSRRRQGAEN